MTRQHTGSKSSVGTEANKEKEEETVLGALGGVV